MKKIIGLICLLILLSGCYEREGLVSRSNCESTCGYNFDNYDSGLCRDCKDSFEPRNTGSKCPSDQRCFPR